MFVYLVKQAIMLLQSKRQKKMKSIYDQLRLLEKSNDTRVLLSHIKKCKTQSERDAMAVSIAEDYGDYEIIHRAQALSCAMFEGRLSVEAYLNCVDYLDSLIKG